MRAGDAHGRAGGGKLSGKTGIDCADGTLNPWTWRCTPVSEECSACYAQTLTNRWQGAGAFTSGPPVLRPGRLLLPWTDPQFREARRIFLVSMSDPFHGGIRIEDQALVFAMMAADRRHIYQVLTKRPGPMRAVVSSREFAGMVRDALGTLAAMAGQGRRLTATRRQILSDIEAAREVRWPLPNVMLGVSAGNNRWAHIRLPVLRATPAAARFVSAEPLIGPIEADLTGIAWLICGGESGSRFRPMDLAWARSLRDQCRAQGVAFWFKQVGGITPKAGGDLLDGRTWKQHCEGMEAGQ
jgi:protein gp37